MPFHAGALIRHAGRFHVMSDPFRRPQDFPQMMLSPIGTLADKFRILRMRRDTLRQHLCAVMKDPTRPTRDVLQAYEFSDAMVRHFFQPFLGGVFLETELSTPCWIFELVWAAFCRGVTALPRDGMGAIAQQLAGTLPPGTIRLNHAVQQIHATSVVLESGESLRTDVLVLATDDATAARLRGENGSNALARGSVTLYFDAPAAPQRGPWLMVNGENDGVARTVCVLSEAAPSYAPIGRALISVTATEQTGMHGDISQAVRQHLQSWFGSQVNEWRHLRTDRIQRALPHSTYCQPGTAPPHRAWLQGCIFVGITGKVGHSMAPCCRDGKRRKPYWLISVCRDLNGRCFLGVSDQQPEPPWILIQSLA